MMYRYFFTSAIWNIKVQSLLFDMLGEAVGTSPKHTLNPNPPKSAYHLEDIPSPGALSVQEDAEEAMLKQRQVGFVSYCSL